MSDDGSTLAILLDKVGAGASGELSSPDRQQLAEWLRLLIRVAGSDDPNE
jgi:hypothetical protein